MIVIRPETPKDATAIRRVVQAAFDGAEHASGSEPAIVDALRAAGALTISLVAQEGGDVIGHVAFSPVRINGADVGWFGLGPVAVNPALQRRGTGTSLIGEGLARLRDNGARGCVVLGDPAYYARFGFRCDPGLRYPDAPSEYFQRLSFTPDCPEGVVAYHGAFLAS